MAKKRKSGDEEEAPGFLPTMAPKRDPKVHAAAEKLNSCIDELGTARGRKNDAEAKLIELMEERKLDFYHHGKVKVKLNRKVTANVREVGENEERNGVNPDEEGKDFPDELDEVGQSEVLDGVQEIADEGPSDGADDIRPAKRKK